jgi:hypothetical protein
LAVMPRGSFGRSSGNERQDFRLAGGEFRNFVAAPC